MRPLIAMLCWTLCFYGTPVRAEPAGGFESTGVEAEGESESPGVERPWLRRPLDVRLAQAGEETGVGEGAAVGDVDAQIADLKLQRAGISRKWPMVGMIAGGVLTGIGVATLSVSSLCDWDLYDDDYDHNHNNSDCTGGWVAGGILAGGGLILLGTSGWFLAKRNHERKAIDRQIEKLKNGRTARTAPSWSVGFDLGERKGLRVAWRY